MKSIDSIFECGICTHPYTEIGEHQPFSFGCGHGCCRDCISSIQAHAIQQAMQATCHKCRYQITAPTPNRELIEQMRNATQKMAKLAAENERLQMRLYAIRTTSLTKAVDELVQNPEEYMERLAIKAREFVETGLFESLDDAREKLTDSYREHCSKSVAAMIDESQDSSSKQSRPSSALDISASSASTNEEEETHSLDVRSAFAAEDEEDVNRFASLVGLHAAMTIPRGRGVEMMPPAAAIDFPSRRPSAIEMLVFFENDEG